MTTAERIKAEFGDKCPYAHLVPKKRADNLAFRKKIIHYGLSSPSAGRNVRALCARDLLFFINTFVYTYDPRLPQDMSIQPFITYHYQDRALVDMDDAIGKQDIFVLKSRDMGATWMCLMLYLWRWLFGSYQSFLVVSRNMDYVDKSGDPKCHFWKYDFVLRRLPPFLRPRHIRTFGHYHNEETGGNIDGESTTGNVGRGDRRTSALLDEMQTMSEGKKAWHGLQFTTTTRFCNGTPEGRGNAYYDVWATAKNILRQVLHWSKHPIRRMGLYTTSNGKLHIIDKSYPFPINYPFVLDGRLRSPWYDAECIRAGHMRIIDQELDLNFLGSDFQFFDMADVTRHKEAHARPPFFTGEIEFDENANPTKFVPSATGRLKLWLPLDAAGNPPAGTYAWGADVSEGTGASNSCATFGRNATKEFCAEFVTARVEPHNFAKNVVAIARWLRGHKSDSREPHGVWEAPGPGRSFGTTVMELGYSNIRMKRNEAAIDAKETNIPGWWPSKEGKRALLTDYKKALALDKVINRSADSLDECRYYIITQSNSVEYDKDRNADDPTGARESHGDRVIANALCYLAMSSVDAPVEKFIQIPENCLAARRERRRNTKQESEW